VSSKICASLLSNCVLLYGTLNALLDTADTNFVLILFCIEDTIFLGLLALLVHIEIDVVTACLLDGFIVQPLECPDIVALSLGSKIL